MPNLGTPNIRMNTTIIKTLGIRENHMASSAENLSVSVQDQDDQLGILQRRRIEANIISPIYQIMKRELGQERAADIIREAITEDARAAGARLAACRRCCQQPGPRSVHWQLSNGYPHT